MAKYINAEKLIAAMTDSDLLDKQDILEWTSFNTEDVAPVRHGAWNGESDGYAETADGEMAPVVDVWYCSECGHCIDEGIDNETLLPNYCPNCGAFMWEDTNG